MGKTFKGGKGPGYEYWGKRSNAGDGKHLNEPGEYTKKVTHRKERRQGKNIRREYGY